SPDADTVPISVGPLSVGGAAASGQTADVPIDNETTEDIVAPPAVQPMAARDDLSVTQDVVAPSEHEFEYLTSVPVHAVSPKAHVAHAGASQALAHAAAGFSSFRADAAEDQDRVLTSLRSWTPTEEPAESGTNPLRVLVMVLAIGLAVGIAGGYLL